VSRSPWSTAALTVFLSIGCSGADKRLVSPQNPPAPEGLTFTVDPSSSDGVVDGPAVSTRSCAESSSPVEFHSAAVVCELQLGPGLGDSVAVSWMNNVQGGACRPTRCWQDNVTLGMGMAGENETDRASIQDRYFAVWHSTDETRTRVVVYGGRCEPGERLVVESAEGGVRFVSTSASSVPWFQIDWRFDRPVLRLSGDGTSATLPTHETITPASGIRELHPRTLILGSPVETMLSLMFRIQIRNERGDVSTLALPLQLENGQRVVRQIVSDIEAVPNHGIAWAAPAAQAVPHPMLVLTIAPDSQKGLKGVNCLEQINQAEYVVLRRDSEEKADVECSYYSPANSTWQVAPRTRRSALEVYEARTGLRVATRTFWGERPTCPKELSVLHPSVVGSEPKQETIDAWLRTL
jgi:hypothetical protein